MGEYTRKFGNENSGFVVAHDDATSSVRVRTWGFWPADLASSFAEAVVEGCNAASPPIHLLVVARELRPQREEGQAAIASMMTAVKKLHLASRAFVVSSTITKMQLLRIARETSAVGWNYFELEQLAIAAFGRRKTSEETA